MEYTFKVIQPATTFFRGEMTVQAVNKEDAIELIKDLTNEELEEFCTEWELAEEGADTNGFIEVWDEDGEDNENQIR